MPQEYAGQGRYRVSCNDCGLAFDIYGVPTGHRTIETIYSLGTATRRTLPAPGQYVTDYFTWDRNGSRFYSICKACKTRRVRAAREQYRRQQEGIANSAPVATTPNLDRRFGVEIECIAPLSHAHLEQELRDAGLTGWRVKYDGSLPGGGAEVVSPPLSGDAGIADVRTACRVLRRTGCTVTRQCGLHVHHEVRDVTIEQARTLTRLWHDNQNVIDGLVSPSRRDGRNTYCGRLTDHDLRIASRASDLRHLGIGKYKVMNWLPYGRYGTVEIRQHQGTLDAEKIVSWLQFGQAMIEQARCATAFQASRVTTLVENLTHLDDTAGTFLLGRAVRFGAVAI